MKLPDRLAILHVHTLPVVSGSGINTLLTMLGSKARGHRVAMACESAGPLTELAGREGLGIRIVPALGREVRPFRDLSAVIRIARLLRAEHFDVVHTHNSKAGFIGRLAGRLARTPLVIHTVHGFAFHDAESLGRRMVFRNLERLAAHWCDGMIFISQPLVDWADREAIRGKAPRTVIYSGIHISAFQKADGTAVREELRVKEGQFLVGIVSKLWEGKGHDLLLKAWKQILDRKDIHPSPVLAIVGGGHLESHLKALTARLGLQDSVRFTGFRTDVPEVTAALDISVLPSLFEGMGRVAIEAIAAGKPIVASGVGGIPDIVKDGVNGLLVPPGDERALETALHEVLTNDDLRNRLSANAEATVRPEYSSEWMVEQIHRFYEKAAEHKGRTRA